MPRVVGLDDVFRALGGVVHMALSGGVNDGAGVMQDG